VPIGGARVGHPRWAEILTVTVGSSIAARSIKAKTRLSIWAQLMRTRVKAKGEIAVRIGDVRRLGALA